MDEGESNSRPDPAISANPFERPLQTFIPSLLSPLTMPPIPYIVPVQRANLQALHTLLTTIARTERAARWRGEILDGVGRLVVALHERGVSACEGDKGDQLEVRDMEGKDRGGVAAGSMDSDAFAMDNDTSDRQGTGTASKHGGMLTPCLA